LENPSLKGEEIKRDSHALKGEEMRVNLPRFTGQLDKAISPSKKKGGGCEEVIISSNRRKITEIHRF